MHLPDQANGLRWTSGKKKKERELKRNAKKKVVAY